MLKAGRFVCGFLYADFDGSHIPNGVDPTLWRSTSAGELEGVVPSVDFRQPKIVRELRSVGVNVVEDSVENLTESSSPWFYVLTPYAVPELVDAFLGIWERVGEAIEAGNCFIVVDFAHEGYSEWMFIRIYDALSVVPLPARQVVLLSGDLNVARNHESYVAQHGIASPIEVQAVNYFELFVARQLRLSPSDQRRHVSEARKSIGGEKRAYLSFNRRPRPHRLLLVGRLNSARMLTRGLVSFPAMFEGQEHDHVIAEDAVRLGLASSLIDDLRSGYEGIRPMLPLSVDMDSMDDNLAEDNVEWPYLATYFSAVTESLFFEGCREQIFLSEKIWKPVMNLHPFVLFGDAGSLAMLRRLGYRTFSPYIDESYDEIRDHERRFDAALSEVKRLSSFPNSELERWYTSQQDVLLHNYERLMTAPQPFGRLLRRLSCL